MVKEFFAFLREYKIFSLAVAFIMGEATSGLVNSLVKDVLLPVAAPLLREESWREAAVRIGPVSISYGIFLSDLINFLILAMIIFLVARKFLAMEKEANKK